ncbi:MAG: hypothetical protein ACOYIK_03885 [Coriobacteriales bacterium]|jgi:hypothetical protein
MGFKGNKSNHRGITSRVLIAVLSIVTALSIPLSVSSNALAYGSSSSQGSNTTLASSEDTGGSSSTNQETVTAVELFEVGDSTWSTSTQIDDAGDSIELFMQVTLSNSDYISWATWTDRVGTTYSGSYLAYSSDESVATVSTQDLVNGQVEVTAKGEGTAEITVVYTPYEDSGESITSSTFTVTVPEQTPEYVTDLQIVDEDGNAINDNIELFEVGDYEQLYVKLTWYNSETGETWTEQTSQDDTEIDGVTWESDNDGLVYVNKSTGRIKLLPNGNGTSAKITAQISKGKGATEVEDSIYVVYSAVGGGNYVPAEDLTIRVEYENMPVDYTPEEHVFTIDEVIEKCGGLKYQAYTYFRGNGAYTTHFAQGVNLYNVLDLVDVNLDDVISFTFKSEINDGYYTPFSYEALYNTLHYFCWDPEAAYTNGLSGISTPTTPLLAVAATTVQGDDFYKYMNGNSPDWSKIELNGDQQFRLEVGCTGTTDIKAQSKSVYNVDTIVIKLKGGPNTGSGTDEHGSGDTTGNGGNGTGGSGNGNGSGGTGTEGTGAGSTGAGKGTSSESGSGGNGGEAGSSNYGTSDVEGNERWKVYEMMNDLSSTADPIPYENPLEPFAMPLAGGIIVAGGTSMGLGYRRRMGYPIFNSRKGTSGGSAPPPGGGDSTDEDESEPSEPPEPEGEDQETEPGESSE